MTRIITHLYVYTLCIKSYTMRDNKSRNIFEVQHLYTIVIRYSIFFLSSYTYTHTFCILSLLHIDNILSHM